MKNNICWIDVVKYEDAGGGLKAIYDNVTSSDGNLDNLYQAFSLRPHVIKPADDLYKAVLHNDDNALPKWFSELISTFVAIVTGCEYARSHHGANFVHLLGNEKKAESIILSLEQDDLNQCGDEKEVCALRYVRKLCREPENISFEDISLLSNMGWRDGEILEIVQIVSTLSYFCRVINGVGISLAGDRIGLY